MVGTKERALRQWERRIKGLEEYVLAERREYYEERRRFANMRIAVDHRLRQAHLQHRIDEVIQRQERERQPIRWPLPGEVVLPLQGAAGPASRRCKWCRFWDHLSHACETPHYACSYQVKGYCVVPQGHCY